MVASRLALAWARVYTRGMPDGDRRARMDELASDLWEHAACGERRAAVQLEIAGRTARGVAADVAWRFAHRSGPLSLTTVRWAGWLAFALGTSLLILLTATSGVAPMLGLYVVDDGSAPGEAREFARVASAVFAVLAAGFALLRRRPRTGVALVTVACAGLSLYVLCMWPMLVPCGVACVAGAATIARRRRGTPLGPGTRRAVTAVAGAGVSVYALFVSPVLVPCALAGAAAVAVALRHERRTA